MYNDDRSLEAEGMGLDLTPFVDAAGKGAEAYAKAREAEAAYKASKRPLPPTIVQQQAPAPAPMPVRRRPNWIAYGIIGVGAIGVFMIVRSLMKRRR